MPTPFESRVWFLEYSNLEHHRSSTCRVLSLTLPSPNGLCRPLSPYELHHEWYREYEGYEEDEGSHIE